MPPCRVSVTAVVRPNDVDSDWGLPPPVASICSSIGCQSPEYRASKRVTVMSMGAVKCPVAEMTQLPPARETVTSSRPTCRPETKTSNSAWLSGFGAVCCARVGAAVSTTAPRSAAVQLRMNSMSSRIPAAPGFSPGEYRALQEGAGFLARTDRGRLLLRGEDRKSYLQGLLSNDVGSLEPGSWCYATLLTPQGRMISDMRVFDLGAAVLLDLEAAVTQTVREHLDKFVITEDVTVEDVSAALSQVGLFGPTAA